MEELAVLLIPVLLMFFAMGLDRVERILLASCAADSPLVETGSPRRE
ncbi:hypothetical protein [Lolliginicoccus levis]|nr:hypothetical protein [Lolliginicoccus levis]